MARIIYERRAVGSAIAGGMGGGSVSESVWVHPRLRERGLARQIEQALAGGQLLYLDQLDRR